MTAEQLARLAEQAAFAARYFATTEPSYARRFADAALAAAKLAADKLAADSAQEEHAPRGRHLAEIKSQVAGGPEVA
jgi:hypothetical protein